MPSLTGTTVATMNFQVVVAGVTRTAVVYLSAHGTGSAFEDFTLQVGTILANAIQAQTGYTLQTADLVTESSQRVFP